MSADVKQDVNDAKDDYKKLMEAFQSNDGKEGSHRGGGVIDYFKSNFAHTVIIMKMFFEKKNEALEIYCKNSLPKTFQNKLLAAGKHAMLDIRAWRGEEDTVGGRYRRNPSRKKRRGGSKRDSYKRDSYKRDSYKRDSYKRGDSYKSNRSKSNESFNDRSEKEEEEEEDKKEEKEKEEKEEEEDKYTGDKNEKGDKNGQGKLEYSNGDVYEGAWKNDLREGKGKMTFANKSSYEGFWFDDEIDGEGTYNYFNGDVYEGRFKRGKKYGDGKMSYENGDKYVGEWKDDKRHGKGKLTHKDGKSFVGKWRKDKREGEGKLMDENGVIIEEGEYEDDSLLISPDKINNILGQVHTKLDQVINSENANKLKELYKTSGIKERFDSFTNAISEKGLGELGSYFIAITSLYSLLIMMINGEGCPKVTDEKYSSIYTFCEMVFAPGVDLIRLSEKTASNSVTGVFNMIMKGFRNVGGIILPWLGPIGIATAIAFAIILVYAFYMYVNMSLEDHMKLRENLRSKHRKKHKHTRKK